MKAHLNKSWHLLVILFLFFSKTHAQHTSNRAFDTITYTVEKGDTVYDFYFNTLGITASHTFSNDTLRYRFNQLKYNIKVVFPYVKEAGRLLNEVNTTLPSLSRHERRKYLELKEKELRQKFELPLKNLYDTQGKLLILLINRETGNSVYSTLKTIKNPIRAAMYQASALANGLNLKDVWDAKKYPAENMIMQHFEQQYDYQSKKK